MLALGSCSVQARLLSVQVLLQQGAPCAPPQPQTPPAQHPGERATTCSWCTALARVPAAAPRELVSWLWGQGVAPAAHLSFGRVCYFGRANGAERVGRPCVTCVRCLGQLAGVQRLSALLNVFAAMGGTNASRGCMMLAHAQALLRSCPCVPDSKWHTPLCLKSRRHDVVRRLLAHPPRALEHPWGLAHTCCARPAAQAAAAWLHDHLSPVGAAPGQLHSFWKDAALRLSACWVRVQGSAL